MYQELLAYYFCAPFLLIMHDFLHYD